MASEAAIPYEQQFTTDVEQEIVCRGKDFTKVKDGDSANLSCMHWGRVPFTFVLERIAVLENTHKDLILNVTCNKGAHDPHWRCSFTITVLCSIGRSNEWQSAEQTMTANRTMNSLIVPILRFTEIDEQATSATFKIKIQISSYAGNCPAMIKSFDQKTTITDATLIVEGRRLYVSRAILAMHSSFFHTLFYDNKFKDASGTEFDLPDVSFDDMLLFLNIIYPNVTDDKPIVITTADTVEVLLQLSERFGADCVKRLMEKYLMGEFEGGLEGFTLARRLLISDRFRLSAPSSMIMNELKNEHQLIRLGGTEEYNELSESIRAAILDMRIRTVKEKPEKPEPLVSMEISNDSDAEEVQPIRISRAARRATSDVFRASMIDFMDQINRSAMLPSRLSISPLRAPPPYFSPQVSARPVVHFDDTATSSAAPRDQSWTHFNADVGRLETAVASFALTSSLSHQLNLAVNYLKSWTRTEYNQTSSATRIPLHGVMVTLINSTAQSPDAIGATVQRLISLVDQLRGIRQQLVFHTGRLNSKRRRAAPDS